MILVETDQKPFFSARSPSLRQARNLTNTGTRAGREERLFLSQNTMSIPFTWLYVINDSFTGLYKIGKSDHPKVRLKQLKNTASTLPAAPTAGYEIVEAWLCPESIERTLHKRYADKRVRGEWFMLDWQDLHDIKWSLAWYQRHLGGQPLMAEKAQMYLEYTQEYARQIRILTGKDGEFRPSPVSHQKLQAFDNIG